MRGTSRLAPIPHDPELERTTLVRRWWCWTSAHRKRTVVQASTAYRSKRTRSRLARRQEGDSTGGRYRPRHPPLTIRRTVVLCRSVTCPDGVDVGACATLGRDCRLPARWRPNAGGPSPLIVTLPRCWRRGHPPAKSTHQGCALQPHARSTTQGRPTAAFAPATIRAQIPAAADLTTQHYRVEQIAVRPQVAGQRLRLGGRMSRTRRTAPSGPVHSRPCSSIRTSNRLARAVPKYRLAETVAACAPSSSVDH